MNEEMNLNGIQELGLEEMEAVSGGKSSKEQIKATGDLNVRTGPGLGYGILGSIKKGGKKPYIDPAKLAGLSYEERMKMYKEAYSAGSVSKGAKDIYKKGGYKKGDYKKGDYKKNGKKSYNNNRPQNKPAPEQKKTFWQKVKSFFGR